MSDIPDIKSQKATLRAEARRRRVAQPDREATSRHICERIVALEEYDAAGAVLFYVDCGSEVETRWLIEHAISRGKAVVVPYCVADDLKLFRLDSMSELSPGAYDILEPRLALREDMSRRLKPNQLDLVILPGVAFDAHGARLGQGKGYYDRLLAQLRPNVVLIAPAFECQIFDQVPMLPHDVPVHRIVTESNLYPK